MYFVINSALAFDRSKTVSACVKWPPDTWTGIICEQNYAFHDCFSTLYYYTKHVDES